MFKLGSYVACIAEGSAEKAVIDVLLDHHLLIFERKDLIEEQVLRERKASTFETQYLRKGFEGKVTVFRILDSRREIFKLSKAYQHKVDVINIITAPEIEMLIILNENRYSYFKIRKMKPSEYCKSVLKYKNVKKYPFVKDYFADPDVLISAIKKYETVSHKSKGENTLLDLLKEKNSLSAIETEV